MLLLVLIFWLFFTPSLCRSSYFPCLGNKKALGESVTCEQVKLPPRLCLACPLRETLKDGQYQDCSNIYDAEGEECQVELQKYVDANFCDPVRKKALEDFINNPSDTESRKIIDYFLYSVCENCCDCVPMGADRNLHRGMLQRDRSNCPAHALYDICAIFPLATHFVRFGEQKPEFNHAQTGCTLLKNWKKSPYFKNWETVPKTKIEPALDRFLSSLMHAADCFASEIWDKCFEMEQKQKNLGQEGTFATDGILSLGKTGNVISGTSTTKGTGSKVDNCNGKVDYGCLDWNIEEKKCLKHGLKCFPVRTTPIVTKKVIPKGTGNTLNNCSGEVKYGCLDWNMELKKCLKHGLRCFPSPTPVVSEINLSSCDGDVKYGCLEWNEELQKCMKHGLRCFPENSKKEMLEQSCDGEVKFGCVDWDVSAKVCHKHGLRCFPTVCRTERGLCT